MFKKYNFSTFADLKSLSQYSLQDLKELVGKKFTTSCNIHEDFLIATFEDSQTIFVIYYDLQGNFKKIFSETWKYPALYFERKNTLT
jgi:hypothetical protein